MDDSSPMDTNRRKVMEKVVALLCQESGFISAEPASLSMLTRMMQSMLWEMGRTTRQFTELAGRVQPSVSDVTMAFVDMGIKVDPAGLRVYAQRQGRPVASSPETLPLPKVPTILSTGMKRKLPSYIPDHFPPMPDSHAYIRTPTHKKPITDYAVCRQKTSQQKINIEQSITRFATRTSDCYYLFPEKKEMFPLITPRRVSYLDALIPKDHIFEENDNKTPANAVQKEKPGGNLPGMNDKEANSQPSQDSSLQLNNPFLKPAVPMKRKSLPRVFY